MPPPCPPMALALVAAAMGCASSTGPAPHGAAAAPAPTPMAQEGSDGGDPRVLVADATFADLVATARTLDQRATDDGAAACLLRALPHPAGAHRLEGGVAPAVRPLPDPPDRLDVTPRASAVAVLSRWGLLGTAEPDRLLVSFTEAPPVRDGPVVAVALTAQGVWITGHSGDEEGRGDGALAPDAAVTALQDRHSHAGLWVVTAEARVPLHRLYALLRRMPEDAPPVVLAVALPPGTRAPDTPTAEDEGHLCAEGLEPPAEGAPQGHLDPSRARDALAPLQDTLPRCATYDATVARHPARLGLHLRIDADGGVADGCVTHDETGSPRLRRCVLAAAMDLRFPPPEPPGWVDLAFPVAFQLRVEPAPRPVCSD